MFYIVFGLAGVCFFMGATIMRSSFAAGLICCLAGMAIALIGIAHLP